MSLYLLLTRTQRKHSTVSIECIRLGEIEFEIESIEKLGSDHIHLVQKIQHEDIAISECCRGQNTSIYIYIINVVKIIMKTC